MTDRDFIRPPPAFQEYASDLLANLNYRSMNLAERGLTHTLRLELWVHDQLPAGIDELGKILRVPTDELAQIFSDRVGAFFEISAGRITCPELKAYKEKLERRRKKQAEGGSIGGQITQSRLRGPKRNPEGRLNEHLNVSSKTALRKEDAIGHETNRMNTECIEHLDQNHEWLEEFQNGNDWQ